MWSPDGRQILYEQFVDDKRIDLYTINPDGSGRRKLIRVTSESRHCACPVWSPDGTKIAYEAEGENGRPDISVMNADGGDRTQLTHHRAVTRIPTGRRTERRSPSTASVTETPRFTS